MAAGVLAGGVRLLQASCRFWLGPWGYDHAETAKVFVIIHLENFSGKGGDESTLTHIYSLDSIL